MAKIYSENSIGNFKNLNPKEETIKFLLNYSKALRIVKGAHNMYGMLLN